LLYFVTSLSETPKPDRLKLSHATGTENTCCFFYSLSPF